jgi:hypothetical protein
MANDGDEDEEEKRERMTNVSSKFIWLVKFIAWSIKLPSLG